MSANETYYTVPLSLLRAGKSAVEVLEHCVSCGIVNAGIGHHRTYGSGAFQMMLDAARAKARHQRWPAECPAGVAATLWEAALVGAQVVGLPACNPAHDVSVFSQYQRPGAVFFRIRSDWLWNAIHTARQAAGEEDPGAGAYKPLTWREFRLLAALLSGKVNRLGFVFLGWESLQARACGHHSKALFQAGKDSLPAHCQPFSRDVIRTTMDKMEALGFYARCRYARGTRGGLMAYSFRHPERKDLIRDIQKWAAANLAFKSKVADLRAADMAAFAQ